MEIKSFDLSLNVAPIIRWNHIIDAYRIPLTTKIIPHINQLIDNILGFGKIPVFAMINVALTSGLVYNTDEIMGISNYLGIEANRLVLMQLMYEMCACCTTVIINDEIPILFRTMDWDLTLLKEITINVNFFKDGIKLFTCSTWAGYLGIFTGMKENWGIAVNYRRTGNNFMSNISNVILGSWPIGALVRDALENAETYEVAKQLLSNSKLISPVYFCLVGKEQGIVIIRDREGTKEVRTGKLIVQCNKDRHTHENILYSIEREEKVKEMLKQDSKDLWKLVTVFPILNHETLYATRMCPSTNEYESRLT